MSSNEAVAAIIIGNSTSSLAGFVAAELLQGTNGDQTPEGEFEVWKGHLAQRFEELRAALALEEPALLTNELKWSSAAFHSRSLPPETLSRTLEIMSSVVSEKLPPSAAEPALAYLEEAASGLAGYVPTIDTLDASKPNNRLALEYLETVLRGERNEAITLLVEALEGGTDVFDLYEHVLMPAQREVGNLWHAGSLNVAEEHFCTHTTQRAMTILTHRAGASTQPGGSRRTALASAAVGNSHDMPLRVLADFFEIRGWRSILIGQTLPASDLAMGIRAFEVDLLLLSATLSVHLPELKETINDIRESDPTRDLRVLVGGRALDAVPALWQKLGADAYAPTARAALDEADRLFA